MNADLMAALERYEACGWATIQLHGLRPDAATCTCRAGTACTVAGKHPVDAGWQQQRRSLAERIDDYRRRPWAHNAGVLTGKASGVVVLDVDPKDNGEATLGALLAAHEPLPPTFTVRTGSGGWHYYFADPGVKVANSAGLLGSGLDIRGDGGQVVAPPSVSGKGPYVLDTDTPPAELPGWLLDRLARPAPPPVSRTRPVHAGTAVTRVQAVLQFAATPSTSRNSRLFWAACRLGEMAEAGQVDRQQAALALHAVGNSLGLDDIELLGFDGRGGTIWSGLNRRTPAGAA